MRNFHLLGGTNSVSVVVRAHVFELVAVFVEVEESLDMGPRWQIVA